MLSKQAYFTILYSYNCMLSKQAYFTIFICYPFLSFLNFLYRTEIFPAQWILWEGPTDFPMLQHLVPQLHYAQVLSLTKSLQLN